MKYSNLNNHWYYNQRYDNMSEKSIRGCFYTFVAVIIITVAALLLSSCKSIQYVPVETIKTEYQNHTDTIKEIDSVFSEKETIIREADSALVAKLGLQLKANERAILILQKELQKQVSMQSEHSTDTVIKTDSIQVPYPVERKLTKGESLKMDAGGIAMGVCVAFIIIVVVYFIIRKYRKI